jgi:hypothetical protein
MDAMTNSQHSDDDSAGPITSEQVRRFGPPALVGVLALLFVFQNTGRVSFRFLWLTFEWPLWIMLLVFALVGAVVFWGVARRRRSRKAVG